MKIVREHINEKFTEDSDPIRDMGIGIDNVVQQFLKEVEIKWDLLDPESRFLYHPKGKFIRIVCFRVFDSEVLKLYLILRELLPKYSDILKVTQWPSRKHHPYETKDAIIKVK